MNSWINLDALWGIVVVGLVAGAGLPALFALGLRALNPSARPAGRSAVTGPPAAVGPVGYAVAVLCFATVVAAIAWGIFVIVNHS
ncbi:hypothetical protein [Kitasatospora sp. NPDC005751]|uniref:hypothetical protein n=1 Tax=Kitasatospora sp. NPDC005751 TaxID=3157064 RepID=UPI0033E33192